MPLNKWGGQKLTYLHEILINPPQNHYLMEKVSRVERWKRCRVWGKGVGGI